MVHQINALLVQKRSSQNNKCIKCQCHFRLCCFYFVVLALYSNLTNVSMLQYTFTLCLLRVKVIRLNYYQICTCVVASFCALDSPIPSAFRPLSMPSRWALRTASALRCSTRMPGSPALKSSPPASLGTS